MKVPLSCHKTDEGDEPKLTWEVIDIDPHKGSITVSLKSWER